MNTDKMIRTSKSLTTFFKILRKTVLICMVAVILFMVCITGIHLIDPGVVIGEDFHMIDIGTLTIELAREYAPNIRNILLYAWSLMVLGIICAALIYYALGIVLRILLPMTQGQPFAPSVGNDIRKMGYVCLALGIAQNIANILDTVNAIRIYKLEEFIDSAQIVSVRANYHVDLTFLILFFVLLLMSHVFRYGAELQQLSDETL